MPTKRGYITQAKYTEITNRSINNTVEWERQANQAEELLDTVVGPHPPFNPSFELDDAVSTATTITGDDFNSDKDDFYKNMRVRVKEGTGKGEEVFITGYAGDTKIATVSGVWVNQPDTNSAVIVDQNAVFPRREDFDPDGRPTLPDFVTTATAYILEFWDIKGGDCGFNADVFNDVGGKLNEEIEDYLVKYDWSRDVRELTGRKAYEYLLRSGAIRRVGTIL